MRHVPTPHLLLGGFGLAVLLTAATLSQPGLGPEVREALDTLLLDEYRSEAAYQRVVDDLGDVRPFSRIVHAEQRHAEMLLDLYTRYELDAPDNPFRAATSPGYATLAEACAAGVVSEQDNAALYDAALALDLPDDVRSALEHNRMATVEHHMPAFERCAAAGSGAGDPHGGMGMGAGPRHGADCPHQGNCARRGADCLRR